MNLTTKAFLILGLIAFYNNVTFSQGVSFNYAKQIGNTGLDVGRAITTDLNGNVYSVGFFSGSCDFDPGVGTFILTSNGLTDAYVTKFGPTGNFIWAKKFSGTDEIKAHSVSIDTIGNIFVGGSFIGTADFDPGSSTYNLSCFGGTQEDGFIVKLDGSGNFIWAAQIGGTSNDYIYSIKADKIGNIYSTGKYSGVCDFDPGVNTYTLSANYQQCFVLKLNSNGVFNWAKTFISNVGSEGQGINIDSYDNVFTTGNFGGITDFDPNTNVFSITSNTTSSNVALDVFISKLDSSGNFVWAKAFQGPGNNYGTSITTDNLGNVYSCGYFADIIDLDPGLSTSTISAGTSVRNIFVTKLNSLGNFQWARKIGGTNSDDRAYSICLDIMDNAYIAGSFNGNPVNFDTGISNYTISSLAADNDIFISKYDKNGNFIWAKALQGIMDDKAFGVNVDLNGNVYSTGSFNGLVDFDPSVNTYTLFNPSTSGISDIFIIKLSCISPSINASASNSNICLGTTITLNATGATSYTWSNGVANNGTLMPLFSNTYSVTGTDSAGCKSNSSASVFINVNQLPFVGTYVSSNNICIGDSVKVYGSGAVTYTCYASDSSSVQNNVYFTPTVTTTYSIYGTSSEGCKGVTVNDETITVNPNPTVTVSSSSILICKGESATLTAQGAHNYLWSTTDITPTIIINPTILTTYTVLGTDSSGCKSSFSISQDVSECIGISEFGKSEQIDIIVYPNPSNGRLTIKASNELSLNLTNILGQDVIEIKLSKDENFQNTIDNLSMGIYILDWVENNERKSIKIVVYNRD